MASIETSGTMNILLFNWISQNLKTDTKGRHPDLSRSQFQRSVKATLKIRPSPYGPQCEIRPLVCMSCEGESCPLCLSPPKELWSCPSILQHGRTLGHILILSIWFLLTSLFLLLPLPMESRLWLSTVQPGWKNTHLGMYRVLNEKGLNMELTGYYWGIQ